jgi:hypothetical protein
MYTHMPNVKVVGVSEDMGRFQVILGADVVYSSDNVQVSL